MEADLSFLCGTLSSPPLQRHQKTRSISASVSLLRTLLFTPSWPILAAAIWYSRPTVCYGVGPRPPDFHVNHRLSRRQLSSSSCVRDGFHKPSYSRAWKRTDEETPSWKEPGLPDPVHWGFKAFVCFLTLNFENIPSMPDTILTGLLWRSNRI